MQTLVETIRDNWNKESYIREMRDRDRLVVFYDDYLTPNGMVGYFLTDNPANGIREDIWSLPKENENGDYIYIDRLISNKIHSPMVHRKLLFDYLRKKHPSKKIAWHSRKGRLICLP